MYRTGLIAIVLCLFGTTAAAADFYRYVDQNGVVRFTDDASQIPDPEKDSAQRYQAVPLSIPPAAEGTPARTRVPDAPDSTRKAGAEGADGQTAPLEEGLNSSADLEKRRIELEKQKKRLDDDYRVLAKDLEDLQAQRDAANTKRMIKAYNERAAALNERINKYDKRRQALDGKINAYNQLVGGPGKPAQ